MVATDEDALICDLWETYQIKDWRAEQLETIATLANGLSRESRIRKKLEGREVSLQEMLLAMISDRLSLLWWAKTKDARKGQNRPKSVFEAITKAKNTVKTFGAKTADEFERIREKIIRRAKDE